VTISKGLLICGLLLCYITIFAQIIVYGDTRTQHEIHAQVVARMAEHDFHTVFHTGDLVQQGLHQSEFDNFLSIIDPLIQKADFYPARGNHEKNKDLFLENFPFLSETNYTVIIDSLLWIILDTNERLTPGSAQYQWLEQHLAENAHIPVFIVLHHPVFSSGWHGDGLGLGLFLPALFERFSVRAVFAGHDHNYERSLFNGIYYITTGGGGAPLRDIGSRNDYSQMFKKEHHFCLLERLDSDQIMVRVFDLNGDVIDSFTVNLDRYQPVGQ